MSIINDGKFSLQRLGALLRNRAIEDAPALAVGGGAVLGFNLLAIAVGALPLFNRPGSSAWPMVVLFGGLLLAGRAFARMHDGRAASDWILLPASSLEKYLAAALFYLVVYPIAATAASVAGSLLLYGIGSLAGSGGGTVWNPLTLDILEGFSGYLIVASFVLAGSARFRKIALVKTAAICFGFLLVFSLVFMAGIILFTPEGRTAFLHRGQVTMTRIDLPETKDAALEIVGRTIALASFLFSSLFGYFRVAEKEAVDEVQ